MPTQHPLREPLLKLFHQRPCWQIADLAHSLNYSLISMRRLLKQIGYFRSYTDNGKWYTLRDTPQFNRDGIWHHQNIGFSKHGSLVATIGYLVESSPSGLSAREIAQKLQHPCHAVLTQLHRDQVLDRVKVHREFRYLATAQQTNRRQREQAAVSEPSTPATSLSSQAAIWVLVEYIRNPGQSFEQIAARLQELRQLALSPESIDQFFHEHDLKKTPQAPS